MTASEQPAYSDPNVQEAYKKWQPLCERVHAAKETYYGQEHYAPGDIIPLYTQTAWDFLTECRSKAMAMAHTPPHYQKSVDLLAFQTAQYTLAYAALDRVGFTGEAAQAQAHLRELHKDISKACEAELIDGAQWARQIFSRQRGGGTVER